jgi:hypothetical protein
VIRGDVLRDPKLSYIHPCLNQDRSLGNAARLCMKKLRMKRPELGNKKREREGWWTGRDSDPRPSGFLVGVSCKPDVLRPHPWAYQAELPALGADTRKKHF